MERRKLKKIWIFAGEASGDKYGAMLADELKSLSKGSVEIAGMGGAEMKRAGIDIMVDSTELGVVGFVEVLKHLFTFIRIFISLVRRAEQERPDCVVLIDYPGFNLRFAKQMYRRGIPVVWYVSPQVWVWGKRRIPKLAKYCKKMLVIFPFELEVYRGSGLDVEFVGSPRVDIVDEARDESIKRDLDKFLLLPGSRMGEVDHILEPMLGAVLLLHREYPNLKFMVSAEREAIYNRIKEIIDDFRISHPSLPDIDIIKDRKAIVLQQEAGTGIATSGTVTVECALNLLPIVSVYKAKFLTAIVAFTIMRLFNIKLYRGFFTMPNIIANKMVYRELLQFQVTPENIFNAVKEILPGGPRREQTIEDLKGIKKELKANNGKASQNAAKAILKLLDIGIDIE